MARAINRLTARSAAALREPGMHADGAGLYLRIDQAGARRWAFIYHLKGKRRELGLGSAQDVDLKEARQAADEARALIRGGEDPIAARRQVAVAAKTFGEVAEGVIADKAAGWRSDKTEGQWTASLKQHAPTIWRKPVAEVSTDDIVAALSPIWVAKAETARRLRNRLERVLDVAKVRGWREGENPARLRGHLDVLLTAKRPARGHHAALPYRDAPSFMARLSTREALAARCLQFTIYTAVRSGESRLATWQEIEGDIWRIPAERMKGGREHVVPLSAGAVALLQEVQRLGLEGALIFPGPHLGKPFSDAALSALLRRMAVEVTPHGFRSTFRDWAGDCTDYPREVAEAALAHLVGNAAEQAYRRQAALEKRRRLMQAWSDYLLGVEAKVIPLHG